MSEEEYFDYLKLCAEITDKLDNTAEYESWLLVQDYADYEHRELIRLNNIIKEVREIVKLCNTKCSKQVLEILDKVGDNNE